MEKNALGYGLVEKLVHTALLVIVVGAVGSFACSTPGVEDSAVDLGSDDIEHAPTPAPLMVATGTDVGTLDGDLSVSPMGASGYTIPLWTPEGRNGVTPKLALSYSSNAGESPVGTGWSLQGGMSKIHRCGRSGPRYTRPTAVLYVGDGLCLDGKPLLLVGGEEEKVGAEYRTEPDTFAKIVVNATDTMGPTAFTVYTRDGRVHTYGSTTDTKLRIEGGREFWDASGRNDPDIVNTAFIDRYGWLQGSVRDRSPTPNTIWFRYTHPSNRLTTTGHQEPTLDRIEYVDRGSLYTRVIQFTYSDRSVDQMGTTYIAGIPFDQKKVLDSIDIKVAAPGSTTPASVRFYQLTHQASPISERSLLTQVKECDGNPASVTTRTVACKLPTVLNYEPGSNAYRDVRGGFADLRQAGDETFWTLRTADLNGDGFDDIVYRARPAGSTSGTAPHWYYRLATPGQSAPFGLAQDMHLAENTIPGDPLIVDIDRDGLPDIAVPSSASSTTFYRNNNLVFQATAAESQGTTVAMFAADFGGKGQTTILRPTTTPTLSWGYRVYDRASNVVSPLSGGYPCRVNPNPSLGGWNNYLVDVNATGVPDFLAVSDTTDVDHLSIMRAQKVPLPKPQAGVAPDVNDFQYLTTTLVSSTDASTVKYFFADMNGDGMPDAIRLRQGFPMQLMVNSGAGFRMPVDMPFTNAAAAVRLADHTAPLDVSDPGVRILDYDGDGKQDILVVDNGVLRDSMGGSTATSRSELWVISQHNGFQRERRIPITGTASNIPVGQPAEGPFPAALSAIHNYKLTQIMDYDGDGQPDIVEVLADGLHVYVHDGKKADLLTSVEDGMGKKSSVTYAPLIDRKVYQPGTDCTFPMQCLKRGGWVVASYATDNGLGSNQNTTTFTYQDERLDLGGGGNVGFAEIDRVESSTNTTIQDQYDNFTAWPVPPITAAGTTVNIHATAGVLINRTILRPVDASTTLATTLSTPFELSLTHGGTTYYVRPQSRTTVEVQMRGGVNTERAYHDTQYTYRAEDNDYGGLFRSTTTTNGKFGDSVETETTYTNNDPTSWLIGQQTLRMLTSKELTDAGSEFVNQQITFTPNPTTGALDGFEIAPGSTDHDLNLRVSLTRNAYGEITATSRTDLNGITRTEHATYDSDSVQPATLTDAMGLTTTVTADAALGVLTSSRDANGATSAFDYDYFGRLRRAKRPGGGGYSVTYARDVEVGSDPTLHRYVSKTTRIYDGGGEVHTTTNRLGQQIHEETKSLDGSFSYVDTTYDATGRQATISRPAKVGSAAGPQTSFAYDGDGRVTGVTRPEDGWNKSGTAVTSAVTKYAYDGLVSTITDEMGRQTRFGSDEFGRPEASDEKNDAGQWVHTEYTYGPFGVVRFILRQNGTATQTRKLELQYDQLGRRIKTIDPSFKPRSTAYNAFGEVRLETDGNGATTKYTRDLDGRVSKRVDKDGATTFTWDTATNGKGKLADTLSPSGVHRVFSYDTSGRMTREVWTIGGTAYQVDYSYDSNGRVQKVNYPNVSGFSRLVVDNVYDGNSGLLSQVKNDTSGLVYWQVKSTFADGALKEEAFGNKLLTDYGQSSKTGRVTSIKTTLPGTTTTTLRNWSYGYWEDGNVVRRSDTLANQHERFEYDGLNRIKKWMDADSTGKPLSGGWTVNYSVDDFGNLTRRQFVAGSTTGGTSQDVTFSYNAGTDQLSTAPWGSYSYDNNGDQVGRPGSETVAYNAFELPKTLSGPQAATLAYDASGTRAQKKKSTSDFTDYVAGIYEKRTSSSGVDHVFYVMGRARTVAQVMRHQGGSEAVLYLHSDRLGSVDAVSDSTGKVVEKTKRDPYGVKVTSFNTPTLPSSISASTNKVRLGFTGMEQDDELGLINMQGRAYDPRLGRFVTPDSIIPMPLRGQSYNRYSYGYNNPLRFRDPTGHSGDSCDEESACDIHTNEDGSYTITYPDGNVITVPVENVTVTQKADQPADDPNWPPPPDWTPANGDNVCTTCSGGGGGTGNGDNNQGSTDTSTGQNSDNQSKPDDPPVVPPKSDPPKPNTDPPKPPTPPTPQPKWTWVGGVTVGLDLQVIIGFNVQVGLGVDGNGDFGFIGTANGKFGADVAAEAGFNFFGGRAAGGLDGLSGKSVGFAVDALAASGSIDVSQSADGRDATGWTVSVSPPGFGVGLGLGESVERGTTGVLSTSTPGGYEDPPDPNPMPWGY